MPLQRDQFGHFVRGNRGGPGRPKGKRDPIYLDIVQEVITPEDWRAIVRSLRRYALNGDFDTLKFLAPYLLGRPTTAAQQQDASDRPSPTPVPAEVTGLPAQLSPSRLKESSHPLETEKSRCDEPIGNTTNKQLILKKRA